jgi:glycosyltransferase involved in cell wall biosynthesis
MAELIIKNFRPLKISMENPRFSILIPAYNRAAFLNECIDSVFSQTFSSYEIIVIDDGSTDRTPEVLKSYGTRIKTFQQENQGPDVARNLGAAQATGEYLVFLDSDDFFLPWALATYNRIVYELASPALIIGVLHTFRDGEYAQINAGSNNIIEAFKYRDYLAKEVSVFLSCSNIIVKRSVFNQAGGHRKSTAKTFNASEHDAILRLGTYGPCVILKKPGTVAFRQHGSNSTKNIERMINTGIMSLVRAERQGQYPGGPKRLFDRHSIIGGMAIDWVYNALKARHPLLGLMLFVRTIPYIMTGALYKAFRLFRRRTPAIVFSEESSG